MLSAYVDQGKFMMITMNDADNMKPMNIKIDMDKLLKYGIPAAGRLIDPETKAVLDVNDGTINLGLKPRDYQIWIFNQ